MDRAEFGQQVELSCEATVGGRTVQSRLVVMEVVYNDPEARKHIMESLRHRLMDEILKQWKPVIRVRR